MKKLTTISLLVATSIAYAAAQTETVETAVIAETSVTETAPAQTGGQKPGARPMLRLKAAVQGETGTKPTVSAETAAQVQALRVEMNAKLKAIHEEYRLKFKALGVDLLPPPSATLPVEPRNGAAAGAAATGAAVQARGATTTKPAPAFMRLRLKAENTNASGEVKGASEINVMQFIRGLFGAQMDAAQ